MTTFLAPPLDPLRIVFDSLAATVSPEGPVLTRRMSSLQGLFEQEQLRSELAAGGDPIVYTVASSPVPELPRELPQSVTTIQPGTVGG
ncbi:MAG: glucose-6-phosphate isomerase, partial [Nakamurella sp.]